MFHPQHGDNRGFQLTVAREETPFVLNSGVAAPNREILSLNDITSAEDKRLNLNLAQSSDCLKAHAIGMPFVCFFVDGKDAMVPKSQLDLMFVDARGDRLVDQVEIFVIYPTRLVDKLRPLLDGDGRPRRREVAQVPAVSTYWDRPLNLTDEHLLPAGGAGHMFWGGANHRINRAQLLFEEFLKSY